MDLGEAPSRFSGQLRRLAAEIAAVDRVLRVVLQANGDRMPSAEVGIIERKAGNGPRVLVLVTEDACR